MMRVAFKILLADRAKYLALVLGIAFSTLLISQQSAIFHSVMVSSIQSIRAASAADIWVVKPKQSLSGATTERVDTRVLVVLYEIASTSKPVYVGQQVDVFIATANATSPEETPSVATAVKSPQPHVNATADPAPLAAIDHHVN